MAAKREKASGAGKRTAARRATKSASRPGGGRTAAKPKASQSGAGKVAGIGDDAVRKATGRTWAEWTTLLDADGARDMEHRDVAERLHSKHGLDGWWAQMVTVGYEQATGRRAPNQTASGWEASRSKTFAVPVERLFAAWSDERQRAKWLPEKGVVVRTASPPKSFRMTWADGRTSVEAWFTSKGRGKSQVGVQHRKLERQADVERMKAYWSARLDELARLLGG